MDLFIHNCLMCCHLLHRVSCIGGHTWLLLCFVNRYSTNAENAVKEVIQLLKSPLTSDELNKMIPVESFHSEPDAYTGLLNHFTQKNTDAFIKCKKITLISLFLSSSSSSASSPFFHAKLVRWFLPNFFSFGSECFLAECPSWGQPYLLSNQWRFEYLNVSIEIELLMLVCWILIIIQVSIIEYCPYELAIDYWLIYLLESISCKLKLLVFAAVLLST